MLDPIQSSSAIPTLDDIVQHYRTRGLIAHEHVVRELSPKIQKLQAEIPFDEIKKFVALLTVWPLVEIYKITRSSITTDLGRDERAKIEELRSKYKLVSSSEDIQKVLAHLDVLNEFDIQFINPYSYPKNKFLDTVLSVMCEPLQDHIKQTHQSHTKLLHDAQLGGTVYTVGKDLINKLSNYIDSGATGDKQSAYSFLQRSFICVDKDLELVLFMDNVEGGVPYFKSLEHWRGFNEKETERMYPNRIHEIYIALGAAMYLAERLGIPYVVPRDFELVELARFLGMGEKSVFSEKQGHVKIGFHSETPKTGVYTHSLYRNKVKNHTGIQIRQVYLESFPFLSPEAMFDELGNLDSDINASNLHRRKKATPKTYEKLNTLQALNDIIQNHPYTPEYIKEESKNITQSTTQRISPLLSKQINLF